MNILTTVINTPLQDIDNNSIELDNGGQFGFQNWLGKQNKDRWFGTLVYRSKAGRFIFSSGRSSKGYTSKENALKYARMEFEKDMEEYVKDMKFFEQPI